MAYNPEWPAAFEAEAETVRLCLGSICLDVHHIGSTSMPGAAAKPVIDILAEVSDISKVDSRNPELVAAGYRAMGEYGIPGRRFFIKEAGGRRSHHLHVFQSGNAEIARHLAFRDYLIAHPAELDAYCRLKADLAKRFSRDIEGYIAGKDAFIKDIDRKAAAWR